jgi:HSP20 family protein
MSLVRTRDSREDGTVAVRDQQQPAVWDPFADLEQATRRLARMVDGIWGSSWAGNLSPTGFDAFLPPADLEETGDAYVIEVELPGVHKGDVDIEVTGRRVSITGERKERERTGIIRRRTRTVGRFSYEAVLPGEVDQDGVKAELADGVLTVTLPKVEAERRASRKIPVS